MCYALTCVSKGSTIKCVSSTAQALWCWVPLLGPCKTSERSGHLHWVRGAGPSQNITREKKYIAIYLLWVALIGHYHTLLQNFNHFWVKLLQAELPGPWSDLIAGQDPWEQSALTLEELKVEASEGYDKRLKAGQTSVAPAVRESWAGLGRTWAVLLSL